ncbi:MAG: class I SAM-dependent methyltransferase [Halobacteriaceae archaeon]
MGADPFGRAIRDHYHGERSEPLIDRDGGETRKHAIQRWYFDPFEGDQFLDTWLEGPLLDMGAGAGRLALYFQEGYETVAIEVSDHLVETMAARGVEKPRHADMFALPEQFPRDRFRSAVAIGTQATLAGSVAGLRSFLSDLAYVTTPEATAVLDSYDPRYEPTAEIFGYRSDPAPGLAYRIMHSEYEGDVGRTLLFRLFSPARLREATVGTPWGVAEVIRGAEAGRQQWRAALEKR